MTFESNVVYGPVLGHSRLLNAQLALSRRIPGFLSGAVQADGDLSGGILFSAATAAYAPEQSTMVALFRGLAGFFFSFFTRVAGLLGCYVVHFAYLFHTTLTTSQLIHMGGSYESNIIGG
jgi:hypothetical protein